MIKTGWTICLSKNQFFCQFNSPICAWKIRCLSHALICTNGFKCDITSSFLLQSLTFTNQKINSQRNQVMNKTQYSFTLLWHYTIYFDVTLTLYNILWRYFDTIQYTLNDATLVLKVIERSLKSYCSWPNISLIAATSHWIMMTVVYHFM